MLMSGYLMSLNCMCLCQIKEKLIIMWLWERPIMLYSFQKSSVCLCLRSIIANRAAVMLSQDKFPHDNVPYSCT